MSRTRRVLPEWKRYFHRNPKTFQEIRQNEGLLTDIHFGDFDYQISGLNRIHRHIAHANDDIVVSSYYQTDYKII